MNFEEAKEYYTGRCFYSDMNDPEEFSVTVTLVWEPKGGITISYHATCDKNRGGFAPIADFNAVYPFRADV